MQLEQVWLTDFRGYTAVDLVPAAGLTVVRGPNGTGKTNLLEAVGYLMTLSSFRGVGPEALVREGAAAAVVRGRGRHGERQVLIEAEIPRHGRGRVTINRQPLRRSRQLLELGGVTVFAPDDLVLVKGPPAARRRYIDDGLVALKPGREGLRRDFERVVRQRSRLLAQAGGRLASDAEATLDVWDAKLVETGEALADARAETVARIGPLVAKAYDELAASAPRQTAGEPGAGVVGPGVAGSGGAGSGVSLSYEPSWRAPGLAAALVAARRDELRRGVSLVGPHRDDLTVSIAGMPARTHASQGEQRSLALALRLAMHRAVAEEAGQPPVLLLDDVFSELDSGRSAALLEHLPPGQVLLTTTGALPPTACPELVVEIRAGCFVPASAT